MSKTYVCLECGTSRRAKAAYGLVNDLGCASCSGPLSELGTEREVPKKADGKGWKALRAYVAKFEAEWGPRRTAIGEHGLKKLDQAIGAATKRKTPDLKKLQSRRRTTAHKYNLESIPEPRS